MPSPPNHRFSPSKPPDSDTVTAVSGESHSQRERKVPSTLSALRGGTRLAFGGSSHVAATLPLKPASTTSTERSLHLVAGIPVRHAPDAHILGGWTAIKLTPLSPRSVATLRI